MWTVDSFVIERNVMARVGVLGFLHQSNTFLQAPATWRDFATTRMTAGDNVANSTVLLPDSLGQSTRNMVVVLHDPAGEIRLADTPGVTANDPAHFLYRHPRRSLLIERGLER